MGALKNEIRWGCRRMILGPTLLKYSDYKPTVAIGHKDETASYAFIDSLLAKANKGDTKELIH